MYSQIERYPFVSLNYYLKDRQQVVVRCFYVNLKKHITIYYETSTECVLLRENV